jgi:CheY-like chemotaxis protein
MEKKKIMIVDDNKDFLDELEETLSLSGYEVIAINDSRLAFDIASTTKPELIVLDLKMNGLNGFQVAERLKKSPQTADIPIMAMTGYFNKDLHYKLMATFGMETCIDKPFSPMELIVRIELILTGKKVKKTDTPPKLLQKDQKAQTKTK